MSSTAIVDGTAAWLVLRALAARASRGEPAESGGFAVHDDSTVVEVESDRGWVVVDPHAARVWREGKLEVSSEARMLLDIYMPVCAGRGAMELVVGHLGQSLDGRIATSSGVSQFITGQENLEHTHRMRALFDVVVVGGGTAFHDNPRLTTRLVPGEHATRVVLDRERRLSDDLNLFADGASPTLLFCSDAVPGASPKHGQAEVVAVPESNGMLCLDSVIRELHRRGHRRIFVEGGGVTVSQFLERRLLARLHVAVAPMIIGSGRPSFSLPEVDDLSEALVFECRHFVTGNDVLFDCEVARTSSPAV